VRVNNRQVLNGLLEDLGLSDKAVPLLRSLDKLPKIGPEKVGAEMQQAAGVSGEQASRVLALAGTTGTNGEILDRLQSEYGSNTRTAGGINRLRELLSVAQTVGVPEQRIQVDLSICRGLDYYTGTIYETFLLDKMDIGSVCSGGRYDDLASLFTKQQLPGVGASLGLDRLLAAMEEMKLLPKVSTPAPVFVVQFVAERLGDYQRVAGTLRAAGIGVEVFPEAKRIGQQLQYAEKRGFAIAIIAGDDEFAKGQWKVKHLASRAESVVSAAELVATIQKMLTDGSGNSIPNTDVKA
jgi:histidyl-tRNA synthetase